MDDLAALSDITGPEVLETISERFRQQQCCTYFGDFLLSFNPCQDTGDNEQEIGREIRDWKPLKPLPPSVMALTHRVYCGLLAAETAQTVLIAGRTGSGKTRAAKLVIKQLLGEAGLSPLWGLGSLVTLAIDLLKAMVHVRTPANAASTRAILTTTLLFRSVDRQLAMVEVGAPCLEKWLLVYRPRGWGTFNVFYWLLAGLNRTELEMYYLIASYRLLDRTDGSEVFLDRQDHARSAGAFGLLVTAMDQLGLNYTFQNSAGRELSALLAVLAAILHLGNLKVMLHPFSGRPAFSNHEELRAAADLLGVRADYLEGALLNNTTQIGGEVMHAPYTVEQVPYILDMTLVGLYHRLVVMVTKHVNMALSLPPEELYAARLTAVCVVDSVSVDTTGCPGLDSFQRNMAAESLQNYLNRAILQLDVDSCEQEGVPPYKVKYPDNTLLVQMVFAPQEGVLDLLQDMAGQQSEAARELVVRLRKNKSQKKNPVFLKCKAQHMFTVQHFSHQMTYDASDLLARSRATFPDSVAQLLVYSVNPLANNIACDVMGEQQRYSLEEEQSKTFTRHRKFKDEMKLLFDRLDESDLHYIRCMRPNPVMQPGLLDKAEVMSQLKEANIVEVTRQRKLGYSACLTHEGFVTSFRSLHYGYLVPIESLLDACRQILKTAGLLDRGAVLTRTSVFLRYWHVQRLQALKAEDMRRIVLCQSVARSYLVRKRMGGSLAPEEQASMIQQFCQRLALVGGEAWRTTRDQADLDKARTDMARASYGWQSGRPYSQNGRRNSDRNEDFGDVSNFIPTEHPATFREEFIYSVLVSLNKLHPDTWGKLVYLERGRQVATTLLQTRSVVVDGSSASADSERFGLRQFQNSLRDRETAYIRDEIREGVRLKGDSDGNIYACRMTEQMIAVKGLHNPDSVCLSADVLLWKGQLPFEETIKVFDMKEFRSQIALELKQGQFSKERLRRVCVVGLSFGRDDTDDLQTPCWLYIINITALKELESPEVKRQAQQQAALAQVASEDKIKESVAKQRTDRPAWAKSDQRDHLQNKEGGSRHLRHQLRAQGMNVGEHLGYSWNTRPSKDRATVEGLQRLAAPKKDKARGAEQPRVWAKLEVAIKDSTKHAVMDDAAKEETPRDYD